MTLVNLVLFSHWVLISTRVSYPPCSLPGMGITFLSASPCVLRAGLGFPSARVYRLGLWLKCSQLSDWGPREFGETEMMIAHHLQLASYQQLLVLRGGCLSLYFFWLSLGVDLGLQRANLLQCLWRCLLRPPLSIKRPRGFKPLKGFYWFI